MITLRDDSATIVTSVTYGNSGEPAADANQSLTRSPDVNGSFVLHKLEPGSEGRAFSPGTRLDGSNFLPVPAISSIMVSPSLQSLQQGDSLQFMARAFDSNSQELPDVIFDWRSSTPSVLTVDAQGLGKAAGTGTAQVIASARSVNPRPRKLRWCNRPNAPRRHQRPLPPPPSCFTFAYSRSANSD